MTLMSAQLSSSGRLKNRCFRGHNFGWQFGLADGARARSAGGARLCTRSSLGRFALAARCREGIEGSRVGHSGATSVR
jgi:hypothetical protein